MKRTGYQVAQLHGGCIANIKMWLEDESLGANERLAGAIGLIEATRAERVEAIRELEPKDNVTTMQETVKLLADLKASFEHPGYIDVNVGNFNFAFGDMNDAWMGDFSKDIDAPTRDCCEGRLEFGASPEELALFIRTEIQKQIAKDPHLYVTDISVNDTGGGMLVELVTLRSGAIVGISEEAVAVYNTQDDYEQGRPAKWCY